MFKKIIWAILELSTIGGGTYIFVSTIFNEDGIDHKDAGLGAFLIVLGILLHTWRISLFVNNDKKEYENSLKHTAKSVNTLVIIALLLSVVILYRKQATINVNLYDNESNIETIAIELYDIGHRMDNVETFQDRIGELEDNAHNHY